MTVPSMVDGSCEASEYRLSLDRRHAWESVQPRNKVHFSRNMGRDSVGLQSAHSYKATLGVLQGERKNTWTAS